MKHKYIDRPFLEQFEPLMDLSLSCIQGDIILFYDNDEAIGYVVYESMESYIARFEIFEPFRGEGLSYKMMDAFLNLIDRDE